MTRRTGSSWACSGPARTWCSSVPEPCGPRRPPVDSGHVCPAAADGYAALRRSLGRAGHPRLAAVTARGDVPAGHPAVRADALILTTAAGARRLHGRLPSGCTILDLGERPALPAGDLLGAVRACGGDTMLTEGGPRLCSASSSPRACWRSCSHRLPGAARPGLVAARELLPGRTELAELLSVRQHGSRTFTSGTGCAARTG
jgi:hypothetical protein